ncbi:hypothetical protein V7182_01855 [Neobacillus drentensis]|uniref:hypothetical protein n=1 Tax=Neobacillus drentensis TaxID=220684 RepID=UPI002FFE3933
MLKKWMFLSVTTLFLLSGCQSNRGANEEAYNLKKDRTAPNFMSSTRNNADDLDTIDDTATPKNRDIVDNMSNSSNDKNHPDNLSDRGKNKQHLVEDDITNQNPNFLDLKRTGSGSEAGGGKNTGNDTYKAKQVIAKTNEFVTDSVWINGDRMWVSVYKKGMLSDKERMDAQARLHRKLVQALPRYNIEVRVKEDRR